MIDLRSDTITRPTAAMRQAIAEAEVGDAVHGDDPTLNALESRTAEVLGKEAAVYMPSGTMTNQVAIRTHTEPGDEMIVEQHAHTYLYEAGAPAALAGVSCRPLAGVCGVYSAADLRAALRPVDLHFARTKLVCVEQTSNRGGGKIWPLERIAEVAAAARAANLQLHMDGARLWNAAAATGIAEKEYAKHFDSVSVCFSKGLGAPVGSALAGTRAFVDRARRFVKQFGGGMRQAGIIAAGALFALENHRRRLVDDHANAKTLAEAIAQLPGVDLDAAEVETNIVYFRVTSRPAEQLVRELDDAGVMILALGPDLCRAVAHLDVSGEQIDEAIAAMGRVLAG